MGGASAGADLLAAAADRRPDGRPAGLGQDDRDGQARALAHAEHGSSVAVAACDVHRPAAVDQLRTVGEQVGATVYEQGTDKPTRSRSPRWALDQAKMDGKDVLIVDTAGRLHVDEELMRELVDIRDAVSRTDVLLVVDAMTGQDAVERRRAVRRRRRLRRRRDDQARRRRPRRRRAVGQGRHRQADPVRLDRREARPLRALPPRPDGPADPRHGRRHVAHRDRRAAVRRGPGQGPRAQAAPQRVHARGLPRADEADPQDGPARRTCSGCSRASAASS